MRHKTRHRELLTGLLAVALLGACGSDDNRSSSSAGRANTDAAFLKAMIPHHESAVEMAKIATRRGEHPEINQLAADITKAQSSEITLMEDIYQRLFGKEILPDPGAHAELGISAKDAGMDHMDMTGLETARTFDRAFIDEMVPHHQGAIRMARVAANSDDAQVKRLAAAIIAAQSKEIREMNQWRLNWYGKSSPAGGVPDPESSQGSTSGGGHETDGDSMDGMER